MSEVQKQKVEKLRGEGFTIVRDFFDNSLEMNRGCHYRRVDRDGNDKQVYNRLGL
jgi:hypothetical protein